MRKVSVSVIRCVAGILLFLLCGLVTAHSDHKNKREQPPQVLAPGYKSLSFTAPQVGSYALPVMVDAANGDILTMQGKPSRLHDFLGDKFVILSFIYTQCDDVNGCPLATYVTTKVQNKLLDETELRRRVRFISLSFDPQNDTPEALRKYGESFIKSNFDWQFLTTSSAAELDPILNKYNQSILKEVDENGEETGSISHILRVFLVDTEKRIRNIYSTSFLHADTIINDIKTLLRESEDSNKQKPEQVTSQHVLHGAGDYKDGYENPSYATRALSLQARTGKKADLLKYVDKPPLGLPALPSSSGSKITLAKVQLGRQLFYDRRLSHNNTFSCAMCHIPEQGFSSNELATAVGIEGRTVRRNAPSIYNVAYAKLLFHDGRENKLEQQIWAPLLAHNEMGNPSVGRVIDKINSIPEYRDQFESVFARQAVDMNNLGEAIASYERTLVSGNSAFDRWHFGKDSGAMNPEAIGGYTLFTGKARCVSCHTIDKTHALFSDDKLHNTGIGYLYSMQQEPQSRKILVAPGTWLTVDNATIAAAAEPKPNDLGQYEISGKPDDRWKYRTPTLRNVALTAPYMHDGSLSTLREVVEFYNSGGISNELLDPLLQPLELSATEIDQLLAFLNALTGDNIDEIISDAFAAPVGNTN
ncbi:MAG: cytochrome c peroxidase [Pseudomonadales bacterium]